MIGEIIKKINESYDDFLLECLKPYGVTRYNVRDYAGRIEIFELKNDPRIQKFYLDCNYIFSIEKIWEYKGNTSDDTTWFGFKETYRKFVKEDSDE